MVHVQATLNLRSYPFCLPRIVTKLLLNCNPIVIELCYNGEGNHYILTECGNGAEDTGDPILSMEDARLRS